MCLSVCLFVYELDRLTWNFVGVGPQGRQPVQRLGERSDASILWKWGSLKHLNLIIFRKIKSAKKAVTEFKRKCPIIFSEPGHCDLSVLKVQDIVSYRGWKRFEALNPWGCKTAKNRGVTVLTFSLHGLIRGYPNFHFSYGQCIN